MDSLWESLLTARRSPFHCWTGDRFATVRWSEVVGDARRMTAGLRELGVRPGSRVAAILTNGPLSVRGTLAIWLAGGAVVSLPVPARGMSLEEYVQQIAEICRSVDSPVLLTDAALLSAIPGWAQGETRATAWESVRSGSPGADEPPAPDELAFVQYSSGSTGGPKGCMLTARAIATQLSLILEISDADPGRETVVSWLPLSHDMGIFGCLLFAWAHDMPLALSTPERFTLAARTWFGDLAEFGGTMTAGTNTALHMAARSQHGRPFSKPLVLRAGFIGAERVERQTLLAAVAALRDSGLSLSNFMAAYGMAEATLAVAASAPEVGPSFLAVDAAGLAGGRVVPADPDAPDVTWLTSCGTPGPGTEVTQSDPGTVSELVIRSPSAALGYYGEPGRTRSRFTADGFRSGDLGFRHDGELYVVGRLDDVISVDGRNVNTREIEVAVDALDSVRPGCSAVLDLGGGGRHGRLVLVTELRRSNADLQAIADAASQVAMAKAGIAIDTCVFLRRGSVPKTPSGKIQRYRARQLLLIDALPTVAAISLDSR
jgi:fatty-acyl-CoA synthase